ncbi:quinone-dependent dihydroorotate dehydrogenase [Enemella sp. A6]|uniref:quinone-dependent dihydroorotate dehydrogenase n=1 Tax=Enemella sp. A6 TaxID=3440152 RepID=UPI003EB9BAF3
MKADWLLTGYRGFIRPGLFRIGGGDPEVAHETTLRMLSAVAANPIGRAAMRLLGDSAGDPVTVAGVRFDNRVGLAAGMDKNGHALRAWPALGFGHMELGTVTALAQPGNPKPRMFRLPNSGAVINRMGFNNDGSHALAQRLADAGVRRGNRALGVPVGVSIGKSKVTPLEGAVQDYLTSLRAVAPHADYIAINVSSPNTPGLRELQDRAALTELVDALVAEAAVLAGDQAPVPIFVKLAPDLTRPALDELIEVATGHGISGLIATNTTLARDALAPTDQNLAGEAGGLSGAPLRARSREVVAHITASCDLPVIASGGIMSADDARAMLDLGAELVQVLTGLIYAGPGLITAINTMGER